MPRRGIPDRRSIPHVKKVIAVASGKGGVGKSTVAVNLAVALALREQSASPAVSRRLRVGLLDLDIFGPSVPKLMGLESAGEPHLTSHGALIPLSNHGLPCMSMGFLLPGGPQGSVDSPVVWRGLMVQKAVQQLLFDVDWRQDPTRDADADKGPGLDVLVVDMPPGTGDVPLTLGQLVKVDGSVIVSTPQDVALSDVRKGIAMFRKVSVPITGLALNLAHFTCPSCAAPHALFGSPDRFRHTASELGIDILGELGVIPAVGAEGDRGVPYMLTGGEGHSHTKDSEWQRTMTGIAARVWKAIQ